MSEVFDLDAIGREAEGEPFRFTFGGEHFELPAEADIVAMRLLGRQQTFLHGLERLLGPEQWERISDLPAVLDDARAAALIDGYAKHLGATVGESKASSRSSRSTGGPSKRTSKRTTE